MRARKSFVKPLVPEWVWGLVMAAGLVGLVAGAVLWLSIARCDEVAEVTGRRTQWRLVSGCYVEVDGRWVPRDSWRGEQELGDDR